MQYVKWIAKAITAAIGVILTAIVAGQIDVEPWIEVGLMALVAAIGVFLVPNGPHPDA